MNLPRAKAREAMLTRMVMYHCSKEAKTNALSACTCLKLVKQSLLCVACIDSMMNAGTHGLNNSDPTLDIMVFSDKLAQHADSPALLSPGSVMLHHRPKKPLSHLMHQGMAHLFQRALRTCHQHLPRQQDADGDSTQYLGTTIVLTRFSSRQSYPTDECQSSSIREPGQIWRVAIGSGT